MYELLYLYDLIVTSQQSYSFPAMNLNQLIINQQNMILQAEVADAVSQMEGKEDEDCKVYYIL